MFFVYLSHKVYSRFMFLVPYGPFYYLWEWGLFNYAKTCNCNATIEVSYILLLNLPANYNDYPIFLPYPLLNVQAWRHPLRSFSMQGKENHRRIPSTSTTKKMPPQSLRPIFSNTKTNHFTDLCLIKCHCSRTRSRWVKLAHSRNKQNIPTPVKTQSNLPWLGKYGKTC